MATAAAILVSLSLLAGEEHSQTGDLYRIDDMATSHTLALTDTTSP